MKMKIYKIINSCLFSLFALITIICFDKLPDHIFLLEQNMFRSLFVAIIGFIILLLTLLTFAPNLVSKSKNIVRNEAVTTALTLLNASVFCYYIIVLISKNSNNVHSSKSIILVIAFIMILIGNILPRMPYCSCVGFKLPWIMKDKFCWQKTHLFAGYTAFPFALIQLVVIFFTENSILSLVLGIGMWLFVVLSYSIGIYIVNTQKQK